MFDARMKRGEWADDNFAALRAKSKNGVIRTSVLRGMGVGAKTIIDRTSGGPWQRMLPGLVLLHNGPPSVLQRQTAAVMYGGPDCLLTGRTGLGLHGYSAGFQANDVGLLIPHEQHRKDAEFVVVERTWRIPEVTTKSGLPVAPIDRCLLDAVRRMSDPARITALIAEVVQRGDADIEALLVELKAGNGRGSALPRRVLRELASGAHSVAEVEARALCERSGLPPMKANWVLLTASGEFIAIVDLLEDNVYLAFEVESFLHHSAPAEFAKTLERRAHIQGHGAIVLAHTPKTIRTQPDRVIADLERAYEQAKQRPRPNLRAIPLAEWRQQAS
ncbi:hypothetical protein RhoFasB10_02322 [Rhodococcus sp. B10]|nr:hypothetical protein [Rhodococcus sp. B10]